MRPISCISCVHILFSIILLAWAVATESCSNGEISADSSDESCTKFQLCDHGKPITLSCASGLKFNPKINACDWPENVDCIGNEIVDSSGGSTSSTTTTTAEEEEISSSTFSSLPDISTTEPSPVTNATTNLPSATTDNVVLPCTTSTTAPTTAATTAPTTEVPGDQGPSSSNNYIKFAPYFDVNMKGPSLLEVYKKTGQKDYTLAFALGSSQGCVPKWGAEIDLNDKSILSPIQELQKLGGTFIVATGGAVGPYFEQLCNTVDSLAAAYMKVLDAVNTNHLDIDVESTINTDLVNKALAKVQSARPNTTVSYTLMVQAEDYGLNPPLGSDVLKSAKKNGVRVHIVNPMAMEFGGSSADWGDAVIGASQSVLKNMKEIWPEKSEKDLKKMLGVTPMLGRNFNGRIFNLNHAQKLVNWANTNHIGLLAFWSVGRDNGHCPNGPISATCSSISQNEYQFIKIFQGFKG